VIALLAAAALQHAIAAYDAGRPGEAQRALARLAQEKPRDADVLAWLGAAQMESGGDAEETLRRAVALDTGSWRAHMLLGVAVAQRIEQVTVFRKLELAAEVRRELQRAVELAPESVAAHQALLQFALRAPRIAGGGGEKARAQAEAIARLDSFAGLVAQAEVEGDFRAARRRARTPEQVAAVARASKDVAALEAAVAARPADARLRCELGEALLARGDPDAAADAFATAGELDEGIACAPRGLARAQGGARSQRGDRSFDQSSRHTGPMRIQTSGLRRSAGVASAR
jgi:Flp pilus assembly protein TadD